MQRQLDKVLLHTSHSFGVRWLRQLLTAIFKVQGVCTSVPGGMIAQKQEGCSPEAST